MGSNALVMQYVSTRDAGAHPQSFKAVVMKGLAPDGGLFVPRKVPTLDPETIASWADLSYTELCLEVMTVFVPEADVSRTKLEQIICKSYKNDRWSDDKVVPLTEMSGHDNICVLEQFHGPTCAFKDVALQFLGNLFEHFLAEDNGKTITVLAATSGDTGGAAIEGLRGKKGVQVCIMHPAGKVAKLQQLQMTSVLDANVHNLAVDGDFDNCQAIVKALFVDQELSEHTNLAAVNSINWARILAQIVYYFSAYFQWCKLKKKSLMKDKVKFVVPTGNFGNALAGYYARALGLPISKLVVTTNHNDILHRLIAHGDYSQQKAVMSRAPAMDITVPSNFERYLFLLSGSNPSILAEWMQGVADKKGLNLSQQQLCTLRESFESGRASDLEINEMIVRAETETKLPPCSHTAVGFHVALEYEKSQDLICLSTAHHGKFGDTVQESLSKLPKMPPQLSELQGKMARCVTCPNDPQEVKNYLINHVIENEAQDTSSTRLKDVCLGLFAGAGLVLAFRGLMCRK